MDQTFPMGENELGRPRVGLDRGGRCRCGKRRPGKGEGGSFPAASRPRAREALSARQSTRAEAPGELYLPAASVIGGENWLAPIYDFICNYRNRALYLRLLNDLFLFVTT